MIANIGKPKMPGQIFAQQELTCNTEQLLQSSVRCLFKIVSIVGFGRPRWMNFFLAETYAKSKRSRFITLFQAATKS